MSVRVLTLPGLRLVKEEVEVRSLAGRRLPLALLVYLAVERQASRDVLLGLLWPERDEAHARHSLRQALHELRRALGDCLDVTLDGAVASPQLQTDLDRFERAVQADRSAEALELYGGGFLEGVFLAPTHAFEEWVDRRRIGAARKHRRARRQLVATRLAAGDTAGALVVAERWAEVEPLDEEAQQRTIELLARLGRRAEALAQYERFRQRLRAEELDPLPELAALAAAIAAGELHPTAGGPTAPVALTGDEGVCPPAAAAAAAAAPNVAASQQAASGRWLFLGRRNAPQRTLRRAALVLLAASVVAMAFVGLPRLRGIELTGQSPALAVLPLHNLSPDPANGFFADGVHEEILAHLSRVDGLRVISRRSVLAYGGSPRNIRGIAGELGVRYVLEGSIRRAGDQIRVTVELIDAERDAHLWAESYDGEVGNILALQTSVADHVARAVEARVAPPRRTPLNSAPPVPVQAHAHVPDAVHSGRTQGSR